MNNKTPIFIAAAIGLFILTTSISVNSAIARNTLESEYFGGMGNGGHGGMGFGGMGYGGMGYGGAGPVIQEQVDTGNLHLDKAINKFYNWSSRPSVNNLESRYDSGFPVHLDGNNITLRN